VLEYWTMSVSVSPPSSVSGPRSRGAFGVVVVDFGSGPVTGVLLADHEKRRDWITG
jgi:hypothetical protein